MISVSEIMQCKTLGIKSNSAVYENRHYLVGNVKIISPLTVGDRFEYYRFARVRKSVRNYVAGLYLSNA